MQTQDLRAPMRVKRFPSEEFRTVRDVRPGPTRRSAVVTFADDTKITIGREAEWICEEADEPHA